MEKYFMKESGNEIKFGDMIELDITRENEDGETVYHHLECKFHPALVEKLLEDGIITVEDEEEDEEEEFEGLEEELLNIKEILNDVIENQMFILDAIKDLKKAKK